MITRAAVVPQAPLLVPDLVPGVVEPVAALRTACAEVCASLAEVGGGRWIAVGADPAIGVYGPADRGCFRGYGVDVAVTLSVEAGHRRDLPLPVLIAGWLRAQAGARSVRVRMIDEATAPARCAEIAAELDAGPDPVGLLVLGDGSHRHGPKPPGGPDERAAAFDAAVADAFASADRAALRTLDTALAAELGAWGRAPWQVLAALDGDWRAGQSHSEAPYGVGYHVACWDRA